MTKDLLKKNEAKIVNFLRFLFNIIFWFFTLVPKKKFYFWRTNCDLISFFVPGLKKIVLISKLEVYEDMILLVSFPQTGDPNDFSPNRKIF